MSSALPQEKATFTRHRRSDRDTSQQAASLMAGKITAIQERVLRELLLAGPAGLTDYELEERCGDHGSTFRTRRSELHEAGLIAALPDRRLIKGRNRIVWIAAAWAKQAEATELRLL